MACTATATPSIKKDIICSLEFKEDHTNITYSPDRPNIFYEVRQQTGIDFDMEAFLRTLQEKRASTPRVIVYCQSITMCSYLYAHFHFEMAEASYHPLGSAELAENRLFAMFHSCTPQRNKDVIFQSLLDPDGVVRIVFATNALGMGVDFQGVNSVVHYGAPHSMEDYFQESGRGGRSGEDSRSVIFWKPTDCPMRKQPTTQYDQEVNEVRKYVENSTECRRKLLLQHFDPDSNAAKCCDVCAAAVVSQIFYHLFFVAI